MFLSDLETETFPHCLETLKKTKKKHPGHLLHISFSFLTENLRPVNHWAPFQDRKLFYAYHI